MFPRHNISYNILYYLDFQTSFSAVYVEEPNDIISQPPSLIDKQWFVPQYPISNFTKRYRVIELEHNSISLFLLDTQGTSAGIEAPEMSVWSNPPDMVLIDKMVYIFHKLRLSQFGSRSFLAEQQQQAKHGKALLQSIVLPSLWKWRSLQV